MVLDRFQRIIIFVVKNIFPTVSLLSPDGPFNRSIVSNISLEPEHILQIPFIFTPEDTDPVSG